MPKIDVWSIIAAMQEEEKEKAKRLLSEAVQQARREIEAKLKGDQ